MLSANEDATGWLRSPAAAAHLVRRRCCGELLLLPHLVVLKALLVQ
jgi:hypothetical protein